MQETRSRVASGVPSTLVSSTQRLLKLLLVFWSVFETNDNLNP